MKKRILAVILIVAMTLSMLPVAFAAGSASLVATTDSGTQCTDENSQNAATVYTMTFHVNPGEGNSVFGVTTVLSYDASVIIPTYVEDGTYYDVTSGTDCFEAIGQAVTSGKDRSYETAATTWGTAAQRSYISYTLGTAKKITKTGEQDMFKFTYRLPAGKTDADLNNKSLYIVTKTDAPEILALYPNEVGNNRKMGANVTAVSGYEGDIATTVDYFGADGMSVSCTYPGSTNQPPKPALSGTASITRAQDKTGDIMVGEALTADVTALSDKTNLTYQWQSCATSDGTYADISGATAASYTLTNSEIGKYLKVKVTATNASEYSGSVTSAATGSKIKGVLSGTPAISREQGKTGDIMVGEILTANVSALSEKTAANLTYQWQSCATSDGTYTDISGATAASYTLIGNEIGKYVKVKVTAGEGSDYVGDVLSAATSVVKGPLMGVVEITGSLTVNSQLTASLDDLIEKTAANMSFQWMRCATEGGTYANITGATAQTYTLTTDDIGKYIKVKATATDSSNYVGSTESLSKGPITDRAVTKLEVSYKSGAKATVKYLDDESVLRDQLVVKATFDSGDPDTDYKGYTIDKTSFSGGNAANFSGEIGTTVFVGADLSGTIKVGTVTADYKYDLVQVDIAEAGATGINGLVYNGEAKKPTTTVTYNKKLIQWPEGDTNYGYTVAYGENKNAYEGEIAGDVQGLISSGAPYIKLTGTGNFKGEKYVLFKIAKAENPNTKTTLETSYKYGKAFEFHFDDKDIGASGFDSLDVTANVSSIKNGKMGLILTNGVVSGELVNDESIIGKDVKLTVKAHWDNYKDQTLTGIIRVLDGAPQEIKVSPIEGGFPVQISCGEKYFLGEGVTNESPNGSTLIYASSNEKIIKVDSESGVVEAVAVGEADVIITAPAIGDYAATTVKVPVKVQKGRISVTKLNFESDHMDVSFEINGKESAPFPENLSVNLNGIYFIRVAEPNSVELQKYNPFLLLGAYLEGANKANYEFISTKPSGNYTEELAAISGLTSDMAIRRGDGVEESAIDSTIYALPGTRLTLTHRNGGSYNWRTTVDGVQKESTISSTFVVEAPEAGTEKKLSASKAYNGGGAISIPSNVVFPRIVLTIGSKDADVFGETKTNDVAPIIRNNRTMLPARFVAESLGAKVEWNAKTRQVTITKDTIVIVLTIGSDKATVNGKTVTLDSPAFIENNRTYTPVRFIAENLGALVEWNENTQQVFITKLG